MRLGCGLIMVRMMREKVVCRIPTLIFVIMTITDKPEIRGGYLLEKNSISILKDIIATDGGGWV